MAHEIIIGVSGGIAAYKAASLVSSLVQDGHGVTVVMTRAARKLVGPATFRALTGRDVAIDLWSRQQPLGSHIELAERADLMCVAPATANVIGKVAGGLADDLLSTLLLAFDGPVVLAPAMNTVMWEKASVQRNIATVQADGYHLVGPEEGWLSCRRTGKGRMAEPEKIRAEIEKLLGGDAK